MGLCEFDGCWIGFLILSLLIELHPILFVLFLFLFFALKINTSIILNSFNFLVVI